MTVLITFIVFSLTLFILQMLILLVISKKVKPTVIVIMKLIHAIILVLFFLSVCYLALKIIFF